MRLITTAFLFSAMSGVAFAQSNVWPLETTKTGTTPDGWLVSGEGEGSSDWQVVDYEGTRVLAMMSQSDDGLFGMFGSGFNVITNPSINFLDGTITVRFKAISGHTDQGGGIMWRVQDEDNYYVARFNPLEDNFRFYTVKDGHRRELASASITLTVGWHKMRITQNGTLFQGAIDEKPLLNHTDDTFANAGGVGLWTKADAVTYFADFQIDTE